MRTVALTTHRRCISLLPTLKRHCCPNNNAQMARPGAHWAQDRVQGRYAPRSQNSLSIQVSCASSKHSAGEGSPSWGWCPAAPLALSLEPKPGVVGAEPLGLPPRRMTLYVLSYMHTSLRQEM